MMVAEKNGEIVYPAQIDMRGIATCTPESDLKCASCASPVYYRDESIDGTSAHFAHCPDVEGRDCDVSGESDEHRRMKSQVATRLEYVVPDGMYNTISMEKKLEVGEDSQKNYRKTDVYVDLKTPDRQLGRGLAVEIQHKNDSKQTDEVARDYNNNDISVLWLDKSDFTGGDSNIRSFEQIRDAFSAREGSFGACSFCGHQNAAAPPHKGEIQRSTTCESCGEVFVLFSERQLGFRSDAIFTKPLPEVISDE